MRKEKLFHLLVLLGFTLLSMTISAQTDSRDVYGWLRYDDYNQDEYGICKFKTDAADALDLLFAVFQNVGGRIPFGFVLAEIDAADQFSYNDEINALFHNALL